MGRYREIFGCPRCGHKWKGPVRTEPAPSDGWPIPKCPNLACGEEHVPIGMDLTLNKAPAQIGQSLQVKSIDETAKIVMEDYGMTDLRTDVRESESMTPKLAPALQAQADNYFSPKPRSRRDAKMPFNAGALAAAALSGRLADPVSTQRSIGDVHARRVRPPVHTVADDRFLKH